jgi:hypothetical protein
MEIFTLLLGCVVHITFILIVEGIILLAILYPTLERISNQMSYKFSRNMFYDISEKTRKYNLLINEKVPMKKSNSRRPFIQRDGVEDWGKNPSTNRYESTFIEPINLLLKACAIDEKKYLKIQDNMPYIIYGILLFVLVVCGLFILVLVKSYNLAINYKFIMITSILTCMLISIYAFLVLYFILEKQPYVLNFEDNFYKAFLEIYNTV